MKLEIPWSMSLKYNISRELSPFCLDESWSLGLASNWDLAGHGVHLSLGDAN
jgi:hypothetical protein